MDSNRVNIEIQLLNGSEEENKSPLDQPLFLLLKVHNHDQMNICNKFLKNLPDIIPKTPIPIQPPMKTMKRSKQRISVHDRFTLRTGAPPL